MRTDVTRYAAPAPVESPLTAALVADTHGEDPSVWLRLVDEARPDLILVPGDVTNRHSAEPESVGELFDALTSRAPVFMSLGNHERMSAGRVREEAARTGVRLLEEEWTDFRGLKIGGLTSGYVNEPGPVRQGHFRQTPEPDLGFAAQFASLPGYRLLLCHHPEYYPAYLKNLGFDLILSGHAHGGQWRIFGMPVFAPGQAFFPKYAQGLCDGRLIVSRGLANNAPVPRFGNARELIFIDFIPAAGPDGGIRRV